MEEAYSTRSYLPPMLLGAGEEGDHRMAACCTLAAAKGESHRVEANCTLAVAAVVLMSYLLKLLKLLVLYWTSMYCSDVLNAQIAWNNLHLKIFFNCGELSDLGDDCCVMVPLS